MDQTNTQNMITSVKGYVHSLETFGLVDGPGVRCVVFLQGCRMRCRYCHNPDTWSLTGGEEWTAEDLFKKVYRFKSYWKNNGGITVSGGEALLQMEFVTEFFQKAKAKGVHTALDTSGQPFIEKKEYLEKFDQLMEVTDLFILDIKEMDEEKHRKLTGCSNTNILALARYLSNHNKDLWIRHVLVPDLTDGEKELQDLAVFLKELKTVKRTEILPYHSMGIFKWENLGIEYSLKDARVPNEEEIRSAEKILQCGEFA